MSSAKTKDQELLSIDDAAKLLRCSPATLRWWIHQRKIASYKLGRRRLLRSDDLHAFIESCRDEAKQ